MVASGDIRSPLALGAGLHVLADMLLPAEFRPENAAAAASAAGSVGDSEAGPRAGPGAPGCLQAHAEIRPLARRLAASVPPGRTLHLSGCAKGCAHPGPADLTLVATPSGFDLITGGTAQDAPRARALDAASIDLKGLF